MADQLIIIGNGFDLHCDLDTKFTDYFEETKPPIGDNVIKNFFNLDSYNSNIMYNTHPYFKKSSFWDIYFNLLNLDNIKDWADIEKQINIFLKCESIENIEQSHFLKLINFWFIYYYLNQKSQLSIYEQSIFYKADSFLSTSHSHLPQKLGDYIFKEVMLNSNGKYEKELKPLSHHITSTVSLDDLFYINKEFLYKYLLDELKVFEINIKKYIQNQVEINYKHHAYTNKYNKTITKLANNKPYNLISFNYTRPMNITTTPPYTEFTTPKNCQNFINIHGTSDKDIIIGIDEKGIDESDILYRFTKTYRLFELDSNEISCLNKSVNHIKFYGHSLAAADYSYFQTIFDFYDIYNSDIDLTFYYSNFDGDQRHLNINRVVKLIKTYGNTLSNKDHGKNLLHKLKIENRLSIKEL